MKKILSLLLVALMLVGMLPMNAIHAKAADESYVKVTAAPADWSGEYLIVYENGNVAFNGGLTTLDAASNTVPVTITDDEIAATEAMKKASFTIEKSGSNYTIKSASGYYIGQTASSNGLKSSTTTKYDNTISFSSGKVTIKSNNLTLLYNKQSGQTRFRYFTSNQEAIALYKLEASEGTSCEHTYTEEVTTAATCTTNGEKTFTCSKCEDSYIEVIPATGHTVENGVCTVCGKSVTSYELITLENIAAGDYVIGAKRGGSYPVVYPATASVTDGDLVVSETAVTAVDNVITDDLLPTDAQVFTLSGDNESGFTIGYNNGTEMVYLGYTAGSNRKLAFSKDSSNVRWIVSEFKEGFSLSTSDYYIYQNSTSTSAIRGYASEQSNATGIYLFAKAGETDTPVVPPCDVHKYENGVCTVCGAIDQDWEGEPDTTDPEEPKPAGGYELATYISVGDTVILVTENTDSSFKSEFSGFLTKTTYGDGAEYATVPKGVYVLTVCEGTSAGTYAFKTTDGKFLNYSGTENTLSAVDTMSKNTSWTVIIDENGYANISNVAESARQIWWNVKSPRFACYTGKTLTTANYYGTKLYKYVEAGACEHSWGEWVETTAPTCTDAGVETATCTLCGETKTQSVAATGHSLVYDGNAAFACSKCEYAESFTLSDISTVKGCSGDGNTYYIKGIVTYVNGREIYMEDATGGILVYGSANFEGINIGDELLVWDTITTFSGKIETSSTSTEKYLIVSNNNALPSKIVTIADLVADGTAKEYYGERVVIENVTMGVMGTNNTALTDADGNTINIYKLSGQSDVINENDTVTVTAIVSAYNSTSQLVIDPDTAATDIVEIKDGAAEEIVTVTIAEAKAGTAGDYFQVEGTVTYISGKNVYIQDATGGIVVYLTANAATTQVGDKVKAYGALKLYNGLIELDAVDETNTQFYEILSSGNTVDAQEVTIEGLLADTSNEYLAEKITLNGVYVSYNSYSSQYGNVTYTLTDGNGNTIEIYRVPVASEEECVAGGSIVNVEAIVSAYNGYQLVTDNAKVTVTGTCAHETTELVNDKDATLTAGGYTGDTMCTVCGNYTERGEDTAALTDVDSWGLTLGGDILVNFKIALAESIKDSAQITVAVADKTYTYAAKDYYADGYVYVSASVAAAQMTDEITVTVINGEDQAVKSGYTIKSYAETVLNGDYDDATKALVTAMLHYGAAAQTFFNYNTGAMANEGLASEDDVTIPADAAGEIVVSGSAEGITFYGASLVFENKIAVRFYFTGSAEGIVGAVEKDENDGKFYIEVAGINPQDLDDAVTVEIGELSVSYSPMNYIVRMAEKGDEDLRALVKALYSYHVAAEKLVPDVV